MDDEPEDRREKERRRRRNGDNWNDIRMINYETRYFFYKVKEKR